MQLKSLIMNENINNIIKIIFHAHIKSLKSF